MIIGYLDTHDKNICLAEQKNLLETYADKRGLAIDVFSSDSNIQNLIQNLKTQHHTLLLSNVLCLGNQLSAVKENIKLLVEKGLCVVCVTENYVFEPTQTTDWLIKGIELSLNIRNSMMSTLTKSALKEKRAQGQKLGRSLGSKNRSYVWEAQKAQIIEKLLSGVSKRKIAAEAGICVRTLYNMLKNNPEISRLVNGAKNA